MKKRLTSRQGSVVVEFAVVLPLILLFFLSFIEISRVLLLQHSIDTAAYEGARSAMVPGATAEEAIAAAENLCEIAQLRDYEIKVEPAVLSEETSFITVKVTLPVDKNAAAGSMYFKSKNLVSSVTLMCERPPMVQLTGIPILAEIVDILNPPPPPDPEPEPQPQPEPEPEPQPEPDPTDGDDPEPPPPVDPPSPPPPVDPPPVNPNPELPVYRY